jgi:hypothetical protein
MAKRTLSDVERERQLQRERATARSREVRRENKVIRQLIIGKKLDGFNVIAGRAGELSPEDAAGVEKIVSRWPIDRVLRACPGMGKVRTHEVIAIFRAPPTQRLGSLSMERRLELAKLMQAVTRIV